MRRCTTVCRQPQASVVLLIIAGLICLAAGCSARDGSRSTGQGPGALAVDQTIPAADRRFRFEGRFDFSDPNSPVVIWQASRIGLDFEADSVELLFDRAKGQCFFNADVDGSPRVVEVREGQIAKGAVISGLGPGRHHLTLFKRSEANAGTVHFRGVRLAGGSRIWSPRPAAHRLRMEFIGDSITVGACNEDGAVDQWDNRGTHNAAMGYAAMTAAAFSADHRNTAVSGMGIATGYVEMKAGQIWDRLYPVVGSPRADLSGWVPQVVFVNLGENDDSYPKTHGQSFPDTYTGGYVSLVQAIRAGHPKAHIVLLRGGMFGGAQSESLRKAWEAAVTRIEAGDKAVSHYVFDHWSKNHPRVSDHRAMADELIAWLRQQPFMK